VLAINPTYIGIVTVLWKKQFLPTLEDIKNKEVKNLAKRLKGRSDKETLTNILEWQERNIARWTDRWIMFFLLFLLYIISICLIPLLPINPFIKYVVVILLVIVGFFDLILLASYMLLLFGYLILLVLLVISINPLKIQEIFPIPNLILFSIAFGAFLSLLVYLGLKYNYFKSRNPEYKGILKDIFKISLPIEKILKYRLAICRDYAKLTAALVFNMYPNSKVYFFTIPRHVASAVKIGNNYYIIDQMLPILTKDGWLKKWNKKDADVYISEVKRDSSGKLVIDFKKLEKVVLTDSKMTMNLDKLTEEVAKMLKIAQIWQKKKPDAEIPLKNFATYYENGGIVRYSLARGIKNKLESELCGNVDNISKIEISRDKKDLILRVYMK